MRGTIYTCTVQSGRHNYQITDLHRTVVKLGSQCGHGFQSRLQHEALGRQGKRKQYCAVLKSRFKTPQLFAGEKQKNIMKKRMKFSNEIITKIITKTLSLIRESKGKSALETHMFYTAFC